MVTAIVLAGGTGTRLGGNVPKQYLMAGEKPVIGYCLETFENCAQIEKIVIVCAADWQEFLQEWIDTLHIKKFCGFAPAGSSRQHSIYQGLLLAERLNTGEDDIVLIHDAARPCVSPELIEGCVTAAQEADGSMPVISVKDTVYQSRDGRSIDGLLCRDELFAGQAPECFRFGAYLKIHRGMSEEELEQVRGSSEIAYRNGMQIKLVPGSESNYKITTMEDLEKFRMQIMEKGDVRS